MTNRRRRAREKKTRHARRIAAGAGVAIGATVAGPAVAQANTFQVTNLNDSGAGSLRDAIDQANADPQTDTVVFASGLTGTIHINSYLDVYTSMAINGPGAGKITISADNQALDFLIHNNYYFARSVSISGLTITGGQASGGAGIFDISANLTLDQVILEGNTATGSGGVGGGLLSVIGSTKITNSVVRNNTAPGGGGGIANILSPLTIQRSTLTGNTAAGPGGAIYGKYPAAGAGDIENSTFSGNSSYTGGAIALYQQGANWQIANSTISGNQAQGRGGAISVYASGGYLFNIYDSTIAGNSATVGGGGFTRYDAATPNPFLGDTIVAGNTAPGTPDLQGNFDAAFSLIQNPTGATVNELVAGSDISGANPQLGPLAQNGGPTPTMALSNTSPAIDKGTSYQQTADQRALRRPVKFPNFDQSTAPGADSADIGAFEVQPNSAFTIGKLTVNQRTGVGKLKVTNPGPDSGRFTVSGDGLRYRVKHSPGEGSVKLPVIAKGAARDTLRKLGQVVVDINVRFVPSGGFGQVLSKAGKLIKR